MQIIKSLDLLGKPFKFKIDGGEYFSTILGGIVSVFIYIGVIALTWFFGKDIYLNVQPKQNNFIRYLDSYPYFFLNENNFKFGISLYDSNDNLINDPRAYTISASIRRKTYNWTTDKTINENFPATGKLCNQTYYNESWYSNVDKEALDLNWCPYFNTTFGGSEYEKSAIVPRVRISRCSKDDEKLLNIKCFTDKEISDKYGPFFIVYFVMQNVYYKPNDQNEPIIRRFEEKYFFIESLAKRYKSYLSYSTSQLVSDTGVIFEDDQPPIEFIQFQNYDFFDIGPIMENDAILTVNFRISRAENYFHREYLKIPDALANVGGFMGLVMPLIQFIFSFYIDNQYCIYLYNSLFKLEIEKENSIGANNIELEMNLNKHLNLNINNNLENKENLEKSNLYLNKDSSSADLFKNNSNNSHNLNYSHIEIVVPTPIPITKSNRKESFFKIKENVINKDVKQLISYKEKHKEKVTIRIPERFCYVNCCCYKNNRMKNKNYNLRYELINLVELEIEKKTNIIEIFKIFSQFQLLKKLLLNENQCYLLENRELHTLANSKSTPIEEIEDLNEIKEKQRTEKLLEYLRKLSKANINSNIDILLLKYLNEELKMKLNLNELYIL